MFIAAIARLKYDPHKKSLFDGKLGIWPVVSYEPAKRALKTDPLGVDKGWLATAVRSTLHMLNTITCFMPTNLKYVVMDVVDAQSNICDAVLANILAEHLIFTMCFVMKSVKKRTSYMNADTIC